MPQVADLIAFQRADDAARAGTAGVQADRESEFSLSSYSTTVIRSSSRRSSVAAPGSRRLISGIVFDEILIARCAKL